MERETLCISVSAHVEPETKIGFFVRNHGAEPYAVLNLQGSQSNDIALFMRSNDLHRFITVLQRAQRQLEAALQEIS